MTAAINDCGMYIKMLSDLIAKESNQLLQAHNLTLSQARLLRALDAAPQGECAMKELESHFQVAQSTIAGLASRLERKGLIVSLVSPTDRRVKLVRLTDEGRALCLSSKAHIAQCQQRLRAGLTEAELAQLLSLLSRVYHNAASGSRKDDCPCSKP